jgi:hypothetical protein
MISERQSLRWWAAPCGLIDLVRSGINLVQAEPLLPAAES